MTKDLLSVITCTGARPEAFDLCKKYMRHQTYEELIQWIIVYDTDERPVTSDLPGNVNPEVYLSSKKWREGLNTQRYNMEEALKHVRGDYIVIFEDDELYQPIYLEDMVDLLTYCDLAGVCNSKYYHVGLPGYKEMHNYNHAALSHTALTKSVLPFLQAAIDSGELFFDVHLWNRAKEKRITSLLLSNSNIVIGMKGLPGREGIGAGHKIKDYLLDPNLVKLEEWCGAYASNYLPFIRRNNDRRNNQ